MDRLRVLMSAYACVPGRGSEPGIGWNTARGVAAHHDVWVVTRRQHLCHIEQELAERPVPGMHVCTFDLPPWVDRLLGSSLGKQVYYYLWQLAAYPTFKRLHQQVAFDLAHHITFGRYWAPSLLYRLGIPFVWGPVGGGESAPAIFYRDMRPRGRFMEGLRVAVRRLFEHEPHVRRTARRCDVALATTPQTADRMRRLRGGPVDVLGACALPPGEIDWMAQTTWPPARPVRFVSIGRLLQWKGFHLGLRAFALAGLDDAEYWVVGDGPARAGLQALAEALDIADRVVFWGARPREETLDLLGECHALVHPSLHDSGGWVTLEAMATGRPVLCLDLGGPGHQVVPSTGIAVPAHHPEQVVTELANSMCHLAGDAALRRRMGLAGRAHVQRHYSWPVLVDALLECYDEAVGRERRRTFVLSRVETSEPVVAGQYS